MTAAVATRVTETATGFLALFDDEQRAVAQWPFPSDEERRLWFYTPTDHGGLSLAATSPQQHRATHQLLASGLSTAGHATAAAVTRSSRVGCWRRPRVLRTTSMTADQHEVLSALIDCYLERLPNELADEQKARVTAGFDSLHLAWAGATGRGHPHYYRIQGGDLLIGYDNTQRGADHIHSVWRDLSNDFGADVLAAHYVHQHRVGEHGGEHGH